MDQSLRVLSAYILLMLLLLLLYLTQVFGNPVIQNGQTKLQLELTPLPRNILVSCRSLDQSLNICKYRVKWSDSDHLLGDVYAPYVEDGSMKDDIWDLKPCTKYKIEVIAMNETFGVAETAYVERETLPDGPPKIKLFDVKARGSGSVTVSWQLEEPSCAVTSYYITYKGIKLWGDGGTHSASFSFEDVMKESKVEIPELQQYSSYQLCIVANNDIGNGTLECTVAVTEEAKPSPPVGLSAVWVSSTSVTLTWQEPQHVRGVVRHYTVTWGTKSAMSNKKSLDFALIRDGKTTEREYTIEGFDVEEYTVEVTASTGAGEGEATKIDVISGSNEISRPNELGANVGEASSTASKRGGFSAATNTKAAPVAGLLLLTTTYIAVQRTV